MLLPLQTHKLASAHAAKKGRYHDQSEELHTVIEQIDDCLTDGPTVYGFNGARVGSVKMHSAIAGCLLVATGHGPIGQKNLYIPLRK